MCTIPCFLRATSLSVLSQTPAVWPSSPDHALAQRQLKKHKLLPRPRSLRHLDNERDSHPAVDVPSSGFPAASHNSVPRVLKHEYRTTVTATNLPPTPLSHSRTSSGSHSALPYGPYLADSAVFPSDFSRPLATPPDQQSPPTPDVTPPGPSVCQHVLHPSALDHSLSKSASIGSPMDSFETAREEPSSCDDQRGDFLASAPKPHLIAGSHCCPAISPPELRVALERIQPRQTDTASLRTRLGVPKSDVTLSVTPDIEREWVTDMGRPTKHVGFEHLDAADKKTADGTPDNGTHFLTNPAKPVRQTSLREEPLLSSSPKRTPYQRQAPSAPSNSETSIHVDAKRLSGQSMKSNPSNVVEAILVDLPPQRQRTLRHVRKRGALREDTPDRFSSVAEDPTRHIPRSIFSGNGLETKLRTDAQGLSVSKSTATGRARRESWENGSIPVVVVPERRSSSNGRSTKERALRSTSGRRSKRATSPDAAITAFPVPEQELRRGRRRPSSESDHSETKSVDFSLSSQAPSASLSEDRLGAAPHAQESTTAGSPEPQQSPLPEISIQLEPDEGHELAGLGRHDDASSSKKFSSRNTPFSIASFETSGTAPEVSEAMAVQMFLHQNSSVLVVNHQVKPADVLETAREETKRSAQPTIRTTSPGGRLATPPQRDSPDEVDSPLRNPRPPPTPPAQPPAINFIPATPSGSTLAQERQVRQENYFDAKMEPPARRPSIVRRALGRRHHSVDYPPTAAKAPSLLTRTLSLSRNVRQFHSTDVAGAASANVDPVYPRKDNVPAEENRLHPFWHPQSHKEERVYDDGYADYGYTTGAVGLNGSSPRWAVPSRAPKRSFSARMKRTFAIFPIREDELFPAETTRGPELCTIRHTPSGNLRVMRRRASVDSYLRSESIRGAMHAASYPNQRRSFWGANGLRRGSGQEAAHKSAVERRWEGI